MHILIAKGTASARTEVFMHHSWSGLKHGLATSNPRHLIEEQWDMCDAWTKIRDGHLICDGPNIWQYINAFDSGEYNPGDPDNMDYIELFKGKEIFFLPDMEFFDGILDASIEHDQKGIKMHMDKFRAKQRVLNERYIQIIKESKGE